MAGPESIPNYQALNFDIATKRSAIDKAADLLEKASARGTKDGLAQAAVEFESLFLYFMLKSMRGTIERSDIFGDSRSIDMYQSILDDELARKAANAGGLGVAKMLLNQVSPKGTESYQLINRFGPLNWTPNTAEGEPYPLEGIISSPFGYRDDPFTGELKFHRGVDLVMTEGAQIKAVKSGIVTFSGQKKGSGNMVVIKSDEGYVLSYSHNKENLVRQGQIVSKGQPIALVGSTGRSKGEHLHLEVSKEGNFINPIEIIKLRT